MKYWSNRIRSAEPYTAGEQPYERGWIKLNTNENPWPPSPLTLQAVQAGIASQLNRYPDPQASIFREAAARYCNVPADNVFAGNGSDEILALAFGAFFNSETASSNSESCKLIFPDITYSFYKVFAELWALPYNEVPVKDDFSISPESLCMPACGVVLCNPNAPTGRALSRQEVIDIAAYHHKRGTVVIVDEAYAEFGAESVVPDTAQYDNLLVVRTLSKSRSLAGLRAGYAVGNSQLIAGLKRIRDMFNSYTMNTITQLAGAAALDDTAYYESRIQKLIQIRNNVQMRLTMGGWNVIPSCTNFLFMSLPGKNGQELAEQFRTSKILVRFWNKPRIEEYIRVSIGTEDAMQKFCSIAKAIAQPQIN